MARALVALPAAAVLAACQVNVDGAPCAVPGAVDDCPSGQACGNDLRCSERALSCAASRCTPATVSCAGPTGKELVAGCTAADPVCGRPVLEDCAARGLECGNRSGAAACECPEYVGTTIAADPGGSPAPDAFPYPTGAATPRECRFGRLGDALQAAASRAPAPAAVVVHGEPGMPAEFGDGTFEVWPLRVEWNVALAGAAPPAGPTVVRGDPGTEALVSLAGALEGIRVERPPTPGGGVRGPGVETACGPSGTPSLRDVEVDGGLVLDPEGSGTAGLGAGVRVTGDCGATLVGVDVAGAAGPALALDPTNAATITVLGGSFNGSLVGVSVAGSGNVTLAPDPETAASVVVAGNVGEGVRVSGHATEVDLVLDGLIVSGNGGTGMVISSINSASSVRIQQSDIDRNGSINPIRYTAENAPARYAGGVLVAQASVLTPFTFLGNRVFANSNDQVTFWSSDDSWTISAPGCGSDSNVFACLPADGLAVTVTPPGAVIAGYNVWPGAPPIQFVSLSVDPTANYCDTQITPEIRAPPACP